MSTPGKADLQPTISRRKENWRDQGPAGLLCWEIYLFAQGGCPRRTKIPLRPVRPRPDRIHIFNVTLRRDFSEDRLLHKTSLTDTHFAKRDAWHVGTHSLNVSRAQS